MVCKCEDIFDINVFSNFEQAGTTGWHTLYGMWHWPIVTLEKPTENKIIGLLTLFPYVLVYNRILRDWMVSISVTREFRYILKQVVNGQPAASHGKSVASHGYIDFFLVMKPWFQGLDSLWPVFVACSVIPISGCCLADISWNRRVCYKCLSKDMKM